MKPLKRREQVLAAVATALLLVVAGRALWAAWQGPLTVLRGQQAKLAQEIQRKQKEIRAGQLAQQRLAAWNRRSLPSDLETARSLYQNWLLALAEEAGFEGTKIEAGQGRQRGEVYRALRFNLQAQATLERLTQMLCQFYTAGHLHQIRSLSMLPLKGSEKLDVQLSVEALVLPGADRKDKLCTETSGRLAASGPSAYRVIAQRNVFARYRPPPAVEPPPPPPPPFDPAKYVYLTAVVDSAGKPEAWLLERTSGTKRQLHEGDSFAVGDAHAKIVRIGRREVEVELAGERWLWGLGQNLREMTKVPK